MKLGKLNNGQLEIITLIQSGDRFIYNATVLIEENWVSNPEWSDMLELGYKHINESLKPVLLESEYTIETYSVSELEILVNYEVKTHENIGGII